MVRDECIPISNCYVYVKVEPIYLHPYILISLIFCFQSVNRCVTSKDGEEVNFKVYGGSSNCKTDDQGRGVGEAGVNFVYTR